MPPMEEKATMMMHNIIPVLTCKYRDDVNTYFYPEALEAAKHYYWDYRIKTLICKNDENMAEEE